MNTERKIQQVVKKLSFEEAERADDIYWANATVEERLQCLIELRKTFFGGSEYPLHMQKTIHKRHLYEKENQFRN